jgi:hypothetical protein
MTGREDTYLDQMIRTRRMKVRRLDGSADAPERAAA